MSADDPLLLSESKEVQERFSEMIDETLSAVFGSFSDDSAFSGIDPYELREKVNSLGFLPEKGKGFEVVSRELTREEKIARANDYNDFCGEKAIDPEEYAKEKVYDSVVPLKCLSCGFEDDADFEEVLEWLDMTGEDYPKLECPQCGKETLVPKSVYREKKST